MRTISTDAPSHEPVSFQLPMRPAHLALSAIAALLGAFALTFADAARLRAVRAESSAASAALVERLGLTDPVLFTEARYTRHPTQADLQSAFQDHPVAFEHFPSGSLVPPPSSLIQAYRDAEKRGEDGQMQGARRAATETYR